MRFKILGIFAKFYWNLLLELCFKKLFTKMADVLKKEGAGN
jgi:hypothetical protein